jgi:hypothetical protein
MSDEQNGADAAAEQGGVFGKLPASRPGTRSPRRDSAVKAATKPKRAKAAPKVEPKPKPKPPDPEPADRPRPEPAEEPAAEQGGGIDDLAWAGVAAVAEAATLGVRLANRAFGALRDGVDRR